MSGSAHTAFTMAAIIAAGGFMGYLKKGSVPSLVAGLSFSLLFAGSGWLILNDRPLRGHQLALGTSTVLTGVMAMRYFRSGVFMPAGMVALAGLASTAYEMKQVLEWLE